LPRSIAGSVSTSNAAFSFAAFGNIPGIGVHARRVEDPGELEDAIKDVLAHDGPALLDVVTNTQELAMPPSINLERVKGFGLWAIQAVISGRGTELIDVARTSLLR
jgi:pyruvate dehydrogenase (quinone)